MLPTKLTLERLRNADIQYWRVDFSEVDGFKYKLSLEDDWHSISKQEVDAIDSRLFHVLVKLTDAESGDIDGRAIVQTVRFWGISPVYLEPSDGFSPQYIIVVDEVNPIADDTLTFVAMVGETDTVGDITYVKAIQRYLLTEPVEWFERSYPGGRGRLLAGYGLSLPQKELIDYVFDSSPGAPKLESLTLPGQIMT